jgi:hypothetical protein
MSVFMSASRQGLRSPVDSDGTGAGLPVSDKTVIPTQLLARKWGRFTPKRFRRPPMLESCSNRTPAQGQHLKGDGAAFIALPITKKAIQCDVGPIRPGVLPAARGVSGTIDENRL